MRRSRAGLGGATPSAIANGMCVEVALPDAADLVIIENMALVEPEVMEQISWRLLQHYASSAPAAAAAGGADAKPKRRLPGARLGAAGAAAARRHPALVLFNTAYVAKPPWDCYYSWVPECCQNFTARIPEDLREGRGDEPHHALAEYYGFGSISHK
jgi:hypothetical protein